MSLHGIATPQIRVQNLNGSSAVNVPNQWLKKQIDQNKSSQ
jgi:hypothetical protein